MYQAVSHCIMPHHIASCCITLHHAVSHSITLYHAASHGIRHQVYYAVPCIHGVSFRITNSIMPYHIVSCRATWYHVLLSFMAVIIKGEYPEPVIIHMQESDISEITRAQMRSHSQPQTHPPPHPPPPKLQQQPKSAMNYQLQSHLQPPAPPVSTLIFREHVTSTTLHSLCLPSLLQYAWSNFCKIVIWLVCRYIIEILAQAPLRQRDISACRHVSDRC